MREFTIKTATDEDIDTVARVADYFREGILDLYANTFNAAPDSDPGEFVAFVTAALLQVVGEVASYIPEAQRGLAIETLQGQIAQAAQHFAITNGFPDTGQH